MKGVILFYTRIISHFHHVQHSFRGEAIFRGFSLHEFDLWRQIGQGRGTPALRTSEAFVGSLPLFAQRCEVVFWGDPHGVSVAVLCRVNRFRCQMGQ